MFSARKKTARRVARDEADSKDAEAADDGPIVRRPGATKTKSKLRMSFNPEDTIQEANVEPKRFGPSAAAQSLPRLNEERQEASRPSYDRNALSELRNSTPSIPRDTTLVGTPETGLDIAAKFGQSSLRTSAIPSAAEIREKKERRARLAKEQGAEDFISLEDYDSDGEFKPQRMQVGSYIEREDKDTRLVRDDEDFAEGFDEFVEDSGRVTMGRKGLAEQARKERESIRDMIDNAEGSDEDESDSEAERNYAYENAQTHHGMDGLAMHQKHQRESRRPQQPREITQIPKLAVALGRLKEAVQTIGMETVQIEQRRAEIKRERADIKANQDHIQKSLEEAGKEMEILLSSLEANVNSAPERGLESLGTPEVS